MNQLVINPEAPLQLVTIGKRHARILYVLYLSGPLTQEKVQAGVAELSGKLYGMGGIENPCRELTRDSYVHRLINEHGNPVFKISDSGKEFLDEIGQWRPLYLERSTSPNVAEEALA